VHQIVLGRVEHTLDDVLTDVGQELPAVEGASASDDEGFALGVVVATSRYAFSGSRAPRQGQLIGCARPDKRLR